MKNHMLKIFTLAFALIALFPGYAFAMDLSQAKQSGLVGEKPDGLIAAVSANSTEINQLVKETNAGRMSVYKETALKQGVSVSQVQALAAEKLYGLAGRGEYVMTNGQWVRK